MPEPTRQVPFTQRPLNARRLAVVTAALLLLVGSAVLALVLHGRHSRRGAMPTWPVQAGDVFRIKAGDAVIARWAESPDNSGFLVELVEQNGKAVPPKVCALEPDYMALKTQPGGALTVVSQAGAGEWRVRWQGGDTLPHEGNAEQAALNCGTDAVVRMSSAELLSWLKMQTGEPDEYPVMSNDRMYRDVAPEGAPAAVPAAQ